MKKVIALLLALLLVSTGLTAMAEGSGKVISLLYGGGTPLSIDPALNSASTGSNVLRLAHAGLMGYQYVNGEPTLMPELAESFKISDDGLTYVFTLREGLKWSDGSDFFASDFVKSWNRAASPECSSDYSYMYGVIDGVGTAALNISADDS
jgi:ABC-type oligopeptide transport system substrate-binding subunit